MGSEGKQVKAFVVRHPGGPDVLELSDHPDPPPAEGRVLIRVRAFGVNRSEVVTRGAPDGHGVTFPRVLGLECAGEVVEAPGNDELEPGQCVIAVMGGMGKDFDGSYAELVSVPASAAIALSTTLSWPELASVPMAFGTAWGSVVHTLGLGPGQSILVRGAASSVGVAAISIAKRLGATVVATTRSESKRERLLDAGADTVLIDDGRVGAAARERFPGGLTVALELIGPSTTQDTASALVPGGVVCVTGFLGDSWDFDALAGRLGSARLARFRSGVMSAATYGTTFQRIVEFLERGELRLGIDRTFSFGELREAHEAMEANRAAGKLVVEVP